MNCPKCGSEDVTRSHQRGMDKIMQVFICKVPYRCKECWSRFKDWEKPWKNNKPMFLLVLGVMFMVIIFTGSLFITPSPTLETRKPLRAKAIIPAKIETKIETPKPEPVNKDTLITPSTTVAEPENKTEKPLIETKETPKAPMVKPLVIKDTAKKPDSPEVTDILAKHDAVINHKTLILKKVLVMNRKDDFAMAIEMNTTNPDYRHFRLNSPPRYVINLKGAWKYKGRTKIMTSHRFVEEIRIGRHQKYLSIVLDLKTKTKITPVFKSTAKGLYLTIP